jgi:hypothetical protein
VNVGCDEKTGTRCACMWREHETLAVGKLIAGYSVCTFGDLQLMPVTLPPVAGTNSFTSHAPRAVGALPAGARRRHKLIHVARTTGGWGSARRGARDAAGLSVLRSMAICFRESSSKKMEELEQTIPGATAFAESVGFSATLGSRCAWAASSFNPCSHARIG